VTVAVVTRDVLSRAVSGTVGANCRPHPHPGLSAAKHTAFSEKCVLTKNSLAPDCSSFQSGVFLHPPSTALFPEAFVPLPIEKSAAVAAAAASTSEASGGSELESLLNLVIGLRTAPSVADLSIRCLSHSPQHSPPASASQSSAGQSLTSLLQPFFPPAKRKMISVFLQKN
jgi:hypothetical protein